MGMGMGIDGRSFGFDGQQFDPSRTDQRLRLGTVEEWAIGNDTPMDHPFHLHVWPMQVIDAPGHDPSGPPDWRDVLIVPARGQVRVRIPITGFGGRTVYHCHILDHEDHGMMAVVEATAWRRWPTLSITQRWDADSDHVAACLHLSHAQVRDALAAAARSWTDDPRATNEQLAKITQARARIEAATTPAVTPAQGWRAFAAKLDPRLPEQGDWSALADMLDQARTAGVDVSTVTRQLVQTARSGNCPLRTCATASSPTCHSTV